MKTRASTLKLILCPVDLSPASRPALRAASMLADRFGAPISILYVDDPLLVRARLRYDEEELDRRARAELQRFVERATDGQRRATIEVAAGEPAQEILKAAERQRADLIVMGTQGRRGPKKLFFGSTAEAVLRRSRIPVLAVPPRRTA